MKAAAPSSDRIPVIDLSVLRRPLRETDRDQRTRMLEQLVEACTSSGVFYVAQHGVPDEVLRRAVAQFDAFFDLALEERMEVAVLPGEASGYEPLSPAVRELNDSFHCVFGAEEFPHLDLPQSGANRWPRGVPGLEAAVRDTMGALNRLGIDVMSSLAQSLGLPAEYFDSIIGPRGAGSIRGRRYPPRREHEGRLGTNPHVDGLPLAFIVQNDVLGLETDIRDVGWVPIEPRAGTIVCQLGSLWARWTNDRYVPNRHRVVNDDPSRERRSIIYWFPLHPEAIISCLPTCCGADDPPRHAPIRFTEYLAQWVRSFGAEGESTSS